MGEAEKTTVERIHEVAAREFLDKGFLGASLRNIMKTLGMTTGAFYGYYDSKEALFDALVGPHYEHFMNRFTEVQETFKKLSPEEQKEKMSDISSRAMDDLLRYAYANRDAFKLMLTSAEGTRYANLIHDMVEIEVRATHDFAKVMEQLGAPQYNVDPDLEHFLISGLYSAYFDMLIHDIPLEQAMVYSRQLKAFYSAGWRELMRY